MQPMGRKPKVYNFIDNHPQKGYINWWDDIDTPSKKGERQMAKRQIVTELKDL